MCSRQTETARWYLLLYSLAIAAIRASVGRCMSIFYLPLMNEYDIGYAQVSQVLGSFYIGYGVAGLFSSTILKRLGHKRCIIFCALLICFSTALVWFDGPFWRVVLCYGFIPGFCFCVQIVATFSAATKAFSHHVHIGTQAIMLGYSVGSLAGCPLFQILIDVYRWNGAMLIISGTILNGVVLGGLMRPEYPPVTSDLKEVSRATNVTDHESVDFTENPSSEEVMTRSQPRCLSLFVKQFDLQLFKRPTFYLLVLTYTFHSVTFYSTLSFLAPYGAVDVGMSELEASFLPTAVAAGEIISKILYGCFFEQIPKSKQLDFMISQLTLVSVIFFIFPFTSGHVVTIFLSVLIGLFGGGVDGTINGFIVHWFGDQLAPAVYGYTTAISFVVNTCSSILIGALVDLTKKLSNAFYIGSVTYLLAAITLFIKQKFWE